MADDFPRLYFPTQRNIETFRRLERETLNAYNEDALNDTTNVVGSSAVNSSNLRELQTRNMLGTALNPLANPELDAHYTPETDDSNIAKNEGFRSWYKNLNKERLVYGEIRLSATNVPTPTTIYVQEGIKGRIYSNYRIPLDAAGFKSISEVNWPPVDIASLSAFNQYIVVFPRIQQSWPAFATDNKYTTRRQLPQFREIVARVAGSYSPEIGDVFNRCLAEQRIFVGVIDKRFQNGLKYVHGYRFTGRLHVMTVWYHAISFAGRLDDKERSGNQFAIKYPVPTRDIKALILQRHEQKEILELLTRIPRVPDEGSVVMSVLSKSRNPIQYYADEDRPLDNPRYLAGDKVVNGWSIPGGEFVHINNVRDQLLRPHGKFVNPAFTQGCGHIVLTRHDNTLHILLVKKNTISESAAIDGRKNYNWTIPFGRALFRDSSGLYRAANPFIQSFYELEEEYFLLSEDTIPPEKRFGLADPIRRSFMLSVIKHVFMCAHDRDNLFLISYVPLNIFKAPSREILDGTEDDEERDRKTAPLIADDSIFAGYRPYGSRYNRDTSETSEAALIPLRVIADHMDDAHDGASLYNRFMFSVMTILGNIFEATDDLGTRFQYEENVPTLDTLKKQINKYKMDATRIVRKLEQKAQARQAAGRGRGRGRPRTNSQ
jgi:hypothetical protein